MSVLESKIKTLQQKLDLNEKQYKDNEKFLDKIIADLGEKASAKDIYEIVTKSNGHDKHINGLINHINEVQKQIDAFKKIEGPDYGRMIDACQSRIDTNQNAANERMYAIEKSIEHLTGIVSEFKNMADKTDMNLIKKSQQVDSIQRKLDLLDEAFNGFMVPSGLLNGGEDSKALDYIKDSLSSLRREFFKFKDESGANFTLIGESLSKNSDHHDLKALEARLAERIDRNEKSSLKSKNDLRRQLKELDDKVRRNNGVNTSRDFSLNRDDAVLARKHEGWKCATCEKDLVNMSGLPAEFFNWKKMPKRERDARLPMVIYLVLIA